MALRTPPSWLQQGSHPAENDRLTMQGIFSTSGIIGASSLAVTAQGTPNMTVNVAAGHGAVVSSTSNAGVYVAYNDAAVTLSITTADATYTRIDRIVMTINDAYYSGLLNNVTFTVLAGTPSGSPVAPSTPANSISLATISVAAGATSIGSGVITDTRPSASSRFLVWTTATRPVSPAAGSFGFNTTLLQLEYYDGANWSSASGSSSFDSFLLMGA